MRGILGTGLAILAMGATGAAADWPAAVPVSLPPPGHPCLYLTPPEAAAARERFRTAPWARVIGTPLLERADAALGETPDIPHAGGQWAGHYVCQDCGIRLKTVSPAAHACPKCGRTFSGGIYDEAGVAERHKKCWRATLDAALANVLAPKPEYQRRVRDVLVEYASFYTNLPLHDYRGQTGTNAYARGARLTAQTLDESGLLVQIARAYDLVYDAPCFTPEDRGLIETNLIRAMAATIQRNPWGRLNWQSDHNAALISAGLLLRDQSLVDQSVNDPANGFLFQMRKGVLESGLWYEGSIAYHYQALAAHIVLLEAATRAGMDLYALPPVRKMFLAPISQLMPDGTFPPLNDGGRDGIASRRAAYEVAFRRYGDPVFGQLVHPRDTLEGLFWGAAEVPPATASMEPLSSQGGFAEGLAILRDKAGKAALYLDYFKGTTQHTQPVRLHVLLYAHGEIRFVDPATMMYGHPMHEGWGRQTFAHNTVVVNEKIQEKSEGELEAFEQGADWVLARAKAKAAYKGVVLDRTVLMRGNVIVDVFRCTAGTASTFDLPLHLRGTLSGLGEGEPMSRLSESPAYREARNVRHLARPIRDFSLGTGAGRRIAVSVFDTSDCYEARGYGNDLTELVPMILRRQKGLRADFVAVYQLLERGEEPVKASADLGTSIAVHFGNACLTVGDDARVTVEKK